MTGVPLLLVRTPLAHAATIEGQVPQSGSDYPAAHEAGPGTLGLIVGAPPAGPAHEAPPEPTRVQYAPPEGFEDLDGPVQTFFDVYYLDKRIGLYEGTLDQGRFTFSNPAEIALRLSDVHPAKVEAFLSQSLDAHENLRCLPGDREGCGTLAAGETGIVVDPERFRISLFLGREFLSTMPQRDVLLGNPVSGPSLIQNIAGSISSSSQATDGTRFGVVLDTYASIEKTSVVSRVNADDTRGFRWQEAYAQHYFSGARVAGGLIRTEGSANLDTSAFYGAEISSFDRRDRSRDQSSGTPVDVVLPTASRVEIYRNGTLVSARQYPAGLQVLDTNNLPIGSYPIRIVARDSSGIILDETRTFSKTPDLPPPGETNFSVKAGVRAVEGGLYSEDGDDRSGILPESSGETIISVSATRRLAESAAATISVTAVDGEIYPEAEVQLYKGDLRANAALALGPDDQYSAVANVNFQWRDIIASLNARKTEANPLAPAELYDPKTYRPFFQSESSVFGSVSMPVYGGSLGVRAGYSESDLANDRETVGVSYTRPFRNPRFGNGILAFDAVSSNEETRMGVRLTFRRSLEQNSSLNGAVGFDYSRYDAETGSITRTDPLAVIGYTRSGQYRGAALSGNVNAGTANGESSLVFDGAAASRHGEFDLAAGVSQARDEDEADLFLASNVQTGFIFGGSKLHFGTLGFGDAAVLVDVAEPEHAEGSGDGRFRVVVGSQSSTSVRVGQSASILVPSLASARVGLVPEGAPPFDIDLTPREVPLYPGNVVRMTWEASYMVSAIGRLVDSEGRALGNAVVQTSSDLAVTNKEGYFSISGEIDDDIRVRTYEGVECGSVAKLSAEEQGKSYLRLGDMVCHSGSHPPEPKQDPEGLVISQQGGKASPDMASGPAALSEQTKVSVLHQTAPPDPVVGAKADMPSLRRPGVTPVADAVQRAANRRKAFRQAAAAQDVDFLKSPVVRLRIKPEPRPITVSLRDGEDATRAVAAGERHSGLGDPPFSSILPVVVRNITKRQKLLEESLAALERLKAALDARDIQGIRAGASAIGDRECVVAGFDEGLEECRPSVKAGANAGIVVSLKEEFFAGL